MNHHFNPDDDEITQDKKENSKPVSQMIEEAMLDEYFLLVRRIPGISLSPKEYWELDTFTTQYLLDLEKQIMKEEEKSYNGKKSHNYTEFSDKDSPEMVDIVMELTEDA